MCRCLFNVKMKKKKNGVRPAEHLSICSVLNSHHFFVRVSDLLFVNRHSFSLDITRFSFVI